MKDICDGKWHFAKGAPTAPYRSKLFDLVGFHQTTYGHWQVINLRWCYFYRWVPGKEDPCPLT